MVKIIARNMNQPVDVTTDIYRLWESLNQELRNALDAHGVCAVVASEVARFAGTTAVVAMTNPIKQLFDVWIARPDGSMQQTRWESAGITFERLALEGRPVFWEKMRARAREQIQSEIWHLAREAVLAATLPYHDASLSITPRGAICLIDPPPDCPVHAGNLGSLALHITTFLDRAYLQHRSDKQQIEFAVVSEINHALTAKLNLEHIYQTLSDPVRRTLNVQTVSIGLVDPVTEDIVFVAELMGPLFRDLPPIRLKAGEGIAGYVARSGQPLIVNDAYADRRFYSRADSLSGFETHSILCLPLTVESRVMGVLEAINKRDGDFNRQDLALLQAIAGPLAAAIENARLHLDVLTEKRRIETMFASMSEGLLVINREGRITVVNDAFTSLVRHGTGDLSGQLAQDVVSLASSDFAEFVHHVFQRVEPYPQLAADLVQPDERLVPVLISGACIEDDAGNINEALFVFSDLSLIREFERMRDDFFHNIVHELRTPLATILMYARLLRVGKAANDLEKTDRFLGFIERESNRLQLMVRQMLQLAKLEAREIQRSSATVDLNILFEEILPTLADRATEKGLIFSQRIEPELPPVVGNDETLYIVFKNLIENAIKFTLDGGVRVTASTADRLITVTVADDGIGIPDMALPNLFKRFFRASTAVERGIAGTGLGLYMVKEGVEKHGGSIEASSGEGQGTTFTVTLPVASS